MFILNKDSKLVKFSYMLRSSKPVYNEKGLHVEHSKIPRQTTLCRFFWRTFVFMPLFCIMTVTAALTLLILGGSIILDNLVGASITAGAAVLGLLLVEWVKLLTKKGYVDKAIDTAIVGPIDTTVLAVKNSLFFQGLKTLKGKMCPIIYFEGEETN